MDKDSPAAPSVPAATVSPTHAFEAQAKPSPIKTNAKKAFLLGALVGLAQHHALSDEATDDRAKAADAAAQIRDGKTIERSGSNRVAKTWLETCEQKVSLEGLSAQQKNIEMMACMRGEARDATRHPPEVPTPAEGAERAATYGATAAAGITAIGLLSTAAQALLHRGKAPKP